jgi:hypothetical protein
MTEELKKYHHKRGLTKDSKQIGVLYSWGWKGTILFGNVETGKFTEYKTSEIEDHIELISDAVYDSLYDERNVREGEDGSREKTYGKIHDSTLKIYFAKTSINGYWSKQFITEFGVMTANNAIREEFVEEFGHANTKKLAKKKKTQTVATEIFKKHHFGTGGLGSSSLYSDTFDRIQKEEVSEEEITSTVKKHLTMNDNWEYRDDTYESEEILFYIEQAKNLLESI